MTVKISELKRWLDTLDDRDSVYVDDGGLTLVSVLDLDAYLEVGGAEIDYGDTSEHIDAEE